MKFEIVKTSDAEGWQLAHSINVRGKRLPKTHPLTGEDIAEAMAAGIAQVQVFKLEAGDIPEDEAALIAAQHIAGPGLFVKPAGKGRVNLIAETDGLFCSGGAISALNALDDAFSVASLAENAVVQAGELVATIKMVPYALSGEVLDAMAQSSQTAKVKPFQPYSVALICSDDNLPAKTLSVIEMRLAQTGGTLNKVTNCKHRAEEIAGAITATLEDPVDALLILGASAITDERDRVPSAARKAGASVVKVGLPTDPGNLLMVADRDGVPIIGLPGCAKSPAMNGLDWVLARIAAKVPLDHKTLTDFGVGGLLKEGKSRPTKRNPILKSKKSSDNALKLIIAPVVLAAGRSARSGSQHKLLSQIDGQTVVSKSVKGLAAGLSLSDAETLAISVVTGHRAEDLAAAVQGSDVETLHNPDYADGMGTSLALAARDVSGDTDWLLVCLADMPFVAPETIKALIDAAQTESGGGARASVIVPTFHGKRGHPVLWHRKHFLELSSLSGDIGGKAILQSGAADVLEVPVKDPGVLIDLDTPEMLAQFGAVMD